MTSDDGDVQDVDLVAINVAAVNDAPTVAGDGTEEAAPIDEDTPSPTGQTVADLFGGQYSDATDQVAGGSSADAFAGVAVTANGSNPGQGQWQYFNGVILGRHRPGFHGRGGADRGRDLDPLQSGARLHRLGADADRRIWSTPRRARSSPARWPISA